MSVWANFVGIYLQGNNAQQKYAKRNGIGAGSPADCLTSPMEYKYCMIFVLILGVICTLRGAVG